MKKIKTKLTKRSLYSVIITSLAIIISITSISISYCYNRKDNDALTTDSINDNSDNPKVYNHLQNELGKHVHVGVSALGRNYTDDALVVAQKLNASDCANNGHKVVYLTFDDGVSTTSTRKVLDILRNYDVHATFFVTGVSLIEGGDRAASLLKQAFNDGHAIGNHSYSHNYKYLFPNRVLNLDNFVADYKENDKLLSKILGPSFVTRVIRCPGGRMSWQGIEALDNYTKENHIAAVDWNALNGDAEGNTKNAQELYNFAVATSQGKELVVLLMHDDYGKQATVDALPKIIEYFKSNGYDFRTLS
ncbi:polysaccharide deacetylase family protein [Romboutsia weinsteinii]|nr:polysaccharide deacetylase family protein [Romboutsia weinsteinii]